MFREDMENSMINMAPGGIQGAAKVGSPEISADKKYGIFKSSINFIQTDLPEYANCTIAGIFRAPNATPSPQPAGAAPFLFGNYSGVLVNEPSGTTFWCPTETGISITTTRIVDGSNQSNSGITLATVSPDNVKSWHAAIGRVGATTSRMRDVATDRGVTSNPFPRGGNNANKMRIGSSYVANQNGDMHIAAILYWDRELSDSETATLDEWLTKYRAIIGL